MPSEFEQIYYAVSKNGYVLLDDNNYDYSQDTIVLELLKKYKKVVLGDSFNQHIDFLPDGITHLQLGRLFNQPIMNLPGTLKHLIISANQVAYCCFSQSLDYLPEGLKSLIIRLNLAFKLPINNLPIGLKYLALDFKSYHHPINNLPDGLEKLEIAQFDYENTHHLPTTLKDVFITTKMTDDFANIININLIQTHPEINFKLNTSHF